MRKVAAFGLFALGALAATGTLAADDYQAEALLQRALPATTDTEIDGLNWHCSGDKCVATRIGRRSTSSRMDDCKNLAAALGKLSSFASRGKEMSRRDLDSCNRVAR